MKSHICGWFCWTVPPPSVLGLERGQITTTPQAVRGTLPLVSRARPFLESRLPDVLRVECQSGFLCPAKVLFGCWCARDTPLPSCDEIGSHHRSIQEQSQDWWNWALVCNHPPILTPAQRYSIIRPSRTANTVLAKP